MFWIGIVFVLFASVIAFWIGRPIIWLSFNNEKYNAAFRYALVRLRDASEAVAFYRGEVAERTGLRKLFTPVVSNYKRYVGRSLGFNGWNWSMSQTIVPLPYLLQFPRFYNGEIMLGAMTQSASAFGQIQDGLSFFRNVYDTFAGYRAAIIRLDGLVVANEEGRALPEITTMPCVDGTVQLDDIEVRTPDGKQLIKPLDMRLEVGDTLVVTGPSGSGKTTLLRSLAELWPFTSGTLTRPCGPNETMFLSQLPYVPLGDLRAVVTYPSEEGTIDDETLKRMLEKVALPHLVPRLDEVQDWAKVLSPGEQQRIAFARVLLTKPKAVFLDESTSALDEGLEFMLYSLVRTELPDTILVSVSHRSTVEQHHTHELELLGEGEWRFGRVARRRDGTRARCDEAGVASRHGNVHAVPGLGRRADRVGAMGGESLGGRRGGHGGCAGPGRPVHDLGQAVLAHHRRLFQGPTEHSSVGAVGRADAVGDDRRAPRACCSAISPMTSSRHCRSRSRARGPRKMLPNRLLVGDPDPRRPDSHGRRAQRARRIPDAAVHHPVAGVAHPPAHRRLARRRCLLPGTVRR